MYGWIAAAQRLAASGTLPIRALGQDAHRRRLSARCPHRPINIAPAAWSTVSGFGRRAATAISEDRRAHWTLRSTVALLLGQEAEQHLIEALDRFEMDEMPDPVEDLDARV